MRDSSSASCGRSGEAMGLISMTPLQGELHQMQRQVGVGDARAGSGASEARLRVEIAVGVDVDDEGLAGGVDAEVDPAVVAAVERVEGGERDVDALALERGGQGAGEARAV